MKDATTWRERLGALPLGLKVGVGAAAALFLAFTVWTTVRGNPFLTMRSGLTAPAPESVDDSLWVPELPLSTLNVPVTYDLTPVVDALEGCGAPELRLTG